MTNYNRPDHTLKLSEKEKVLDRDGWCCNNCGYVSFHTSKDIPLWALQNRYAWHGFVHEMENKKPFICVKCKLIDIGEDGNIISEFSWLAGGELHFDHKIPLRNNGPETLDNMQALCKRCHDIKSFMEYRHTESTKYAISKYYPIRTSGMVV